jgi:CRP/FNR family transcriptional regulator, anaerobic regulatory protein
VAIGCGNLIRERDLELAKATLLKVTSCDQSPTGCANCSLRAWAQFCQLAASDLARLDQLIIHCRQIKKGASLYHAGSPFESLHVVQSGCLKTTVGIEHGLEQVAGFVVPGEFAGMDGIASGKYQANAVALEDSSVCGISFGQFERFCRKFPVLQRDFHRLLGLEIDRDHKLMLLLGTLHAEERLAYFLLSFSTRFDAGRDLATPFMLPMKHKDIASYLGLKLETVSRLLTRLGRDEIIALDRKEIRIRNVDGLKRRTSIYGRLSEAVPARDFLPVLSVFCFLAFDLLGELGVLAVPSLFLVT